MPIIPRALRKEPVIIRKSVKDADAARAKAAELRCKQILVGTTAFHRYIERMETLEAAGWSWK